MKVQNIKNVSHALSNEEINAVSACFLVTHYYGNVCAAGEAFYERQGYQ